VWDAAEERSETFAGTFGDGLDLTFVQPLQEDSLKGTLYSLQDVLRQQSLIIEPGFRARFAALAQEFEPFTILKFIVFGIIGIVSMVLIGLLCMKRRVTALQAGLAGLSLLPNKINALPVGAQGKDAELIFDIIHKEHLMWSLYAVTTVLGLIYLTMKNLTLGYKIRLTLNHLQRRLAPFSHGTKYNLILELRGPREMMFLSCGQYAVEGAQLSIHNSKLIDVRYDPASCMSRGNLVFSWNGSYLKIKDRGSKAKKFRLPSLIKISLLDKALLNKVLIDREVSVTFLLEGRGVAKVISKPIGAVLTLPPSQPKVPVNDDEVFSETDSESVRGAEV